MTWVKLDDGFADHPKVVGLSDRAFRAYVRGLCYCARQLTDGHIPQAMAKAIAPGRARAELEEADLWIQNGTGMVVHDYLEFQPSRVTVETTRQARSEAGRIGGQRSRKPKQP